MAQNEWIRKAWTVISGGSDNDVPPGSPNAEKDDTRAAAMRDIHRLEQKRKDTLERLRALEEQINGDYKRRRTAPGQPASGTSTGETEATIASASAARSTVPLGNTAETRANAMRGRISSRGKKLIATSQKPQIVGTRTGAVSARAKRAPTVGSIAAARAAAAARKAATARAKASVAPAAAAATVSATGRTPATVPSTLPSSPKKAAPDSQPVIMRINVKRLTWNRGPSENVDARKMTTGGSASKHSGQSQAVPSTQIPTASGNEAVSEPSALRASVTPPATAAATDVAPVSPSAAATPDSVNDANPNATAPLGVTATEEDNSTAPSNNQLFAYLSPTPGSPRSDLAQPADSVESAENAIHRSTTAVNISSPLLVDITPEDSEDNDGDIAASGPGDVQIANSSLYSSSQNHITHASSTANTDSRTAARGSPVKLINSPHNTSIRSSPERPSTAASSTPKETVPPPETATEPQSPTPVSMRLNLKKLKLVWTTPPEPQLATKTYSEKTLQSIREHLDI